MKFLDRVTVAGTRRREDGALVADARVARTGIQLYVGSEVGRPELPLVRVYRPESEVFKTDTLASFAHRPVTNDHPSEMVNADNWKAHAVGHTADEVARDGTFIRVPLMVSDAAAIADIERGKRELSAGYTCDLVWTAGEVDGSAYDAIQTNIRANHIAIVARGRAGADVRVGDAWIEAKEGKRAMDGATKTVMVNGWPIQTTDAGATAIDKLTAEISAKDTELAAKDAAIAAKDAELAAKDAEIAELKGKVLDGAALDALVATRAALIDKAKTLAPKVDVAGLSDAAIRKAVVAAIRGEDAVKDKSEAYIDAAFDILADAGVAPNDNARDALRNASKVATDNGQAAYEARLRDAWKAKPAA